MVKGGRGNMVMEVGYGVNRGGRGNKLRKLGWGKGKGVIEEGNIGGWGGVMHRKRLDGLKGCMGNGMKGNGGGVG